MGAHRSRFKWDEQAVARLKELYARGLSLNQIAQELGAVSRNAVTGKIDRLGLSAGRKPYVAPVRRATARPELPKAPDARLSEERRNQARALRRGPKTVKTTGLATVYSGASFAEGYDGQRSRVGLLDLREHHCRFPIDGDGETRYCGDTRLDHSSYCAAHDARCCTGLPPKGLPAMMGRAR